VPVSTRTRKEFYTRQTIVEIVVDRKLGFESDDPPRGFNWDERHIAFSSKTETLPNPGVLKNHLGLIPRSYWQNGPNQGKNGNSLKVLRVDRVYSDGVEQWSPVLHTGFFNIWRDLGYFYSDDSVIEYIDTSSVDDQGRTTHTLQRDPKLGSYISAIIFKRDSSYEIFHWREFHHRNSFSGIFTDNVEATTLDGDTIYWDDVDTTKREFIAFPRNENLFLQFNQAAYEVIGSTTTPTALIDFNEKHYVATSDGTDDQIIPLQYFPVATTDVHVYVVGASFTEYTIVTSFTGADEVMIDYDLGYLIFGNGTLGGKPPEGEDVYISYYAVPRIEYEEDGYKDEFVATTVDVNPVRQSINKGFVILSRSDLEDTGVASILLETNKSFSPDYPDVYGPVYAGADWAMLKATALSSSETAIPGIDITFEITNDPYVGSIGGIGSTTRRKTSINGIAYSSYVPPATANDLGYFVTSAPGNVITLSDDVYIADTDDVYTYYVLKGDALQTWSEVTYNGRKVIVYEWDASAIHPISGEDGAYIPVRPSSITDGNILNYTFSLPTPYPSDPNVNLGAYWIAADQHLSIRAYTFNERINQYIYSNTLTFRVELPPYMKGEHVSNSLKRVPFGWRILDSEHDKASALAGATFISINPVAGPYDVIDVLDGEEWDDPGGTWDGEFDSDTLDVRYLSPAHFSITFDLTS
jgi:hypothetical protein